MDIGGDNVIKVKVDLVDNLSKSYFNGTYITGLIFMDIKLNITPPNALGTYFHLSMINPTTSGKASVQNFLYLKCTKLEKPIESAVPLKRLLQSAKGIEATIVGLKKGMNIVKYSCYHQCYKCTVNPLGTVDSNITISLSPPSSDGCTFSIGSDTKIVLKEQQTGVTVNIILPVVMTGTPSARDHALFIADGTNFNLSEGSDSLGKSSLEIDLYGKLIMSGVNSTVLYDGLFQSPYKVSHTSVNPTKSNIVYISKTRFNVFKSVVTPFVANLSGSIFTSQSEQIFLATYTLAPKYSKIGDFYYRLIPRSQLVIPLTVVSCDSIAYLGQQLNKQLLNNTPLITLPLFYGYRNGTIKNFNYQITDAFSMYGGMVLGYSFASANSPEWKINGSIANSTNSPQYKKLQIILVESEYKLYMTVTGLGAGGIRYFNFDNEPIKEIYPYLIDGNYTIGSYLIPFNPNTHTFIHLYDALLNNNQYLLRDPNFLNTGFYYSGPHDYCNLLMSDFTYFKFSKTYIELTDKNETIYLNFNLKNALKNFVPVLSVMFFKDYYVDFEGRFNSTTGVYTIPIHLPKNLFPDHLSYRFKNLFMGGGSKIIDMTDLYSVYSDDALLKISTVHSDVMPPVVTQLFPFASYDLSSAEVRWRIAFSDDINGFKEAVVTINSDYDKVPFIKKLTLDDLVGGDQFNPEFEIRIPVTVSISQLSLSKLSCRTQEFSIISVTSQDQGAGFGSVDHIDPLLRFTGHQNLSIIFACPDTNFEDETPPSLASFTYSTPTINTLGLVKDRTFNVELQVIEEQSGINTRINPTIFIHSQFMTPIGFPSSLITAPTGANTISYSAQVTIPFNYGNEYILVSVGGIFDSFMNIKGASFYDIIEQTNNNINFINVSSSARPILDYHTKTYRSEGTVTVFGRNFGLATPDNFRLYRTNPTPPYTYTREFNFQLTDMSFFIFTYASDTQPFSLIIDQTYDNITYYTSNMLPINLINDIPSPTPSPTESPSATPSATPTQTPSSTPEPKIECKGSPLCSGHGECLPTGCNCTLPYFGPD
eukprot:gene9146-11212_t